MRLIAREFLFLALLVSPLAAQSPDTPPAPASTTPATSPATTASTDAMLALNDTIKLNIGDQISFRIVEDRDNAAVIKIFDTGEAEFPYIGRLQAAGKTCKSLAFEAQKLLQKDLYYHATVIIALDAQRALSRLPARITIVGRVAHPGVQDIPYGERCTVSRVVINAGGFTDFASEKKVKIIRKTGAGEKERKEIIVDVAAILKDGELEKDVEVQNGDMIIVPERLVNF